MNACMHNCLPTCFYACTRIHARARTHTHTHTNTETDTHKRTHRYSHARAHTGVSFHGACWVSAGYICHGNAVASGRKRGEFHRARAHTHTHTHRYVCRGYRSQDKGFLLEGALQHVLVPQGRGRGVLRVDVGVLCVDVGRAGGRKLGTNTHAQGIMHAHGRTYVNIYICIYIHTYIHRERERERERETETDRQRQRQR